MRMAMSIRPVGEGAANGLGRNGHPPEIGYVGEQL